MISEKTKHTSCILKRNFINVGSKITNPLLKCKYTYTNTTSRITLSNLRYSQHVFISKSTKSSRICTVSIDLYLVKDSFILSFSVFFAKLFFMKTLWCLCLFVSSLLQFCRQVLCFDILSHSVVSLSCVIDYYTISKRGYLSSILWYMQYSNRDSYMYESSGETKDFGIQKNYNKSRYVSRVVKQDKKSFQHLTTFFMST